MSDTVRRNEEKNRYELELEGGTAIATYVRQGDTLIVTHTGTPTALRGKGAASRLVRGMLADVRAQGWKVVPQCSFVATYFDRHPEEQDLLPAM
jgi:predicted GNAT family acetyltransferase